MSAATAFDAIGPGFRQTASGLVIPAESTRVRQVYSKTDWRAIDRATKLLNGMGIQVMFRCTHPDCATTKLERRRRADGGITLRCAHADREFTAL